MTKVEMLNSNEVVKSTTSKYRYTVEFQTWREESFHLTYCGQFDCTAHPTAEAAEAEIHRTACLWGWRREDLVKVERMEHTTTEVVYHRYKVKG